ncbi:MAG: LysE family translocator [Desulfurococcales archaeon]|nr:LysE family translocator [Desulfurococcales archaeon]
MRSIAVTPSGALSPGPLSAGAVAIGGFTGVLGGLAVALGHTLAELPYVLLLVKSVESARRFVERWRLPLNVVVGAFLVFFAVGLVEAAWSAWHGSLGFAAPRIASLYSAVGYGAVLTLFNPYFLAWWVTVGYPLVNDSSRKGYRGVAVMYLSHVWMDYVWLGLLSWSGGVSRLLGYRAYGVLLAVIACVLAYFAARILIEAFKLYKRRVVGGGS